MQSDVISDISRLGFSGEGRRKTFYCGEYNYSYGNVTKLANMADIPSSLMDVWETVEGYTSHTFNSCLINFYQDGNSDIPWHADDETCIASNSILAVVSVGAERIFQLRSDASGQTVQFPLPPSSLLSMYGDINSSWKHSLPADKSVLSPRYSLSFRKLGAG